MGNSGAKLIKKPDPAKQFRAIQAEITKQLQPYGKQFVGELKKATSNFETKIDFDYTVKAVNTGEPTVTVSVVVKNDGEQVSEGFSVGDLWQALDKTGTRPHSITPKKTGGMLRFQWGGPGSYSAKTRPIARSGGPGRASGPIVFSRAVRHPGFSPRKFTESIGKRLEKQYRAAIDRGVRLGSKSR